MILSTKRARKEGEGEQQEDFKKINATSGETTTR